MSSGVAGTAMGATLSDEQRDLLVESNINDDLSTQAVAQGRRLEEQASHASRELQPGQLAFPNGRIVNVEDLDLDHAYITGNYTSIFADTAKYMKSPLPGAMYVWAKKDDPHALSKVRSHLYRRVELEELHDDCDLPISIVVAEQTVPGSKPNTHTTAGKKNYVVMFDVQLMEVGPEAVKRLYKLPAAQAQIRALGNIPLQQFRDRVKDVTKGGAQVEFESKVVRRPIGE